MAEYAQGSAEAKSDEVVAKAILAMQDTLETERAPWEPTWEECYKHASPRKGHIVGQNTDGEKRGHDLFDTTAVTASNVLAGMLHSDLTNQSVNFMEGVPADPALWHDVECLAWCEETVGRMFNVLNATNFQTEVHELYKDEIDLGTGCLYGAEHEENVIHFSTRAMKEIYIDENNLERIDFVHRKFEWKLRQIVQEWGEKALPEKLLEKHKKGCSDKFTIIHQVCPNDGTVAAIFKFKSTYVLKDEKHILSKGGYRVFPFMVPRWTKLSGEKYGRGPTMDMLPDTKMINVMSQTVIKGAQKTVDPPLMVTDDGVIGNVRLYPGGLTVVRPGIEEPIKPLITDARIDFGQAMLEDTRKRIRSGYWVDQIILREGPQKTAAEVYQISNENRNLMGPIVARQYFEFLQPLARLVYSLMERRGMLSAPPAKLLAKGFDVKFSSVLARAQKTSEGMNITRALSVMAPLVNAAPQTLDLIDTDKAGRLVLSNFGLNSLLSTDRKIKDIRDARAAARAQAAKEAQEAHMAEVAGKVGPAAAQVSQAQTAQQKGA